MKRNEKLGFTALVEGTWSSHLLSPVFIIREVNKASVVERVCNKRGLKYSLKTYLS